MGTSTMARASTRARIILHKYDALRSPEEEIACLPYDCWQAAKFRKRTGPWPDVRLRRAR